MNGAAGTQVSMGDRHREIKRAQGWKCARCRNVNGGRDQDGHIVHLAVVTRDGREMALCQRCK